MRKKLPLGVQDFREMIEGDYLYVDKTEAIYRMLSSGKYFFLSRPRRFGKSLLVNTLGELFRGNKELFRGLWIEDKIDWKEHPVIRLDLSRIGSREIGLEKALFKALDSIAQEYEISLEEESNALRFDELIRKLSVKGKVAILVDEYDKPIIDHIENPQQAQVNREILRNLYSVVKGNDQYIAFFLLTGVSKFTQVSIFSDLNNLQDITIHPDYAQLLGYTQDELHQYFPDYIEVAQKEFADAFTDIYEPIKAWYNGYSWDGKHFVYNPFSILNFLSSRSFEDFWFRTGTPTFLLKLLKERNYPVIELENKQVVIDAFNKFDISNLEINSLLFQSGYLTMKAYDRVTRVVTLDFPNLEVEHAFSIHLLAEFSAQIKEKDYHLKYAAEGKRRILLGIGFDPEAKNIGDYKVEELE